MKKIRIGIFGGAGYTGGELLRVLINHPSVEIDFVISKTQVGRHVWEVHTDLIGDTQLKFCTEFDSNVDLVFLCQSHGFSTKLIHEINENIKIIDLSQDFRIKSHPDRPFVYGLPELNKSEIVGAQNVANPGCFATAIQLALLPMLSSGSINSDIHINATTGSTGAGVSLGDTSHFSWRENNLSVYKPFVHQHLAEIKMNILKKQPEFNNEIIFLPQRGAFTRGIFSCIHLRSALDIEFLSDLYVSFYSTDPFVHLSEKSINLKQVINTNKCLIYLEKRNDQLMILVALDNLLKGASGQAVQNMNLMFGLEEKIGLQLKASAF